MKVAHREWPAEGRLGMCRAGEYAGRYALVTAEILNHWIVYIAPAPDRRHVEEDYDDLATGGDDTMAGSCGKWRSNGLLKASRSSCSNRRYSG